VGLKRPRARRKLARRFGSLERVGDSSEEALELGGNSLGGPDPSSEVEVSWRSAWPSSEAEVHPRGTAVGCLMGR
jgi:hypothetical protein